MNLILVEGIPGSGKSTTARFISLQSERNGLRTKLYHESAFQHPIFIQENSDNHKEWMERYLANWVTYINDQISNETTVVMESALFQNPILRLLHMDIDRDEIIEFIDSIYTQLERISCSLVFLYQNDPYVGINRMMETRGGQGWLLHTYEKYKHEPYYVNRGQDGPDLHLDFLLEYAAIARAAYSKSTMGSLAIDNTNWDWAIYQDKILNYYDWVYKPDPAVPLSQLQKYAGVYSNEEMNVNLSIDLKDNQLFIFDSYLLKPKESNKFYLDNISIVVYFVSSHSGEVEQIIIDEKDLVGNRQDEGTVFVKS